MLDDKIQPKSLASAHSQGIQKRVTNQLKIKWAVNIPGIIQLKIVGWVEQHETQP